MLLLVNSVHLLSLFQRQLVVLLVQYLKVALAKTIEHHFEHAEQFLCANDVLLVHFLVQLEVPDHEELLQLRRLAHTHRRWLNYGLGALIYRND